MLLFIPFGMKCFCQKDSLANKKNHFYISMGVNNSIPKVENYRMEDARVFPQYGIAGGVFFGFQHSIVRFNKFKISIGSELGFNSYNDRNIKIGTFGVGGTIAPYEAVIYSKNLFYSGAINIVSSLSYTLNNTTDLIFYLGAGADFNFITTNKTTQEDITLSKKINYGYIDNSNTLYYVSKSCKFEICKKRNIKKYGIFIGATFIGGHSTSTYPYGEGDRDAIQEFAYRYFILNYGLTYEF